MTTAISTNFSTQITNILHDFNGTTSEDHEIYIPEIDEIMWFGLMYQSNCDKIDLWLRFKSIGNIKTNYSTPQKDGTRQYYKYELCVYYSDSECRVNFTDYENDANYDQCIFYSLHALKLYCNHCNILHIKPYAHTILSEKTRKLIGEIIETADIKFDD